MVASKVGWGVVDSNVGCSWNVVDSEVGKRWQVRVMFDELVVAVGSIVEMGEAQQVSRRINERLHIQILK